MPRKEKARKAKAAPVRHTPLGHIQKEMYWLVALVMFFLERDFITDCLMMIMSWVNVMFFK